ncbi:hypothetical protein ACJX0J_013772 [Zea mays]
MHVIHSLKNIKITRRPMLAFSYLTDLQQWHWLEFIIQLVAAETYVEIPPFVDMNLADWEAGIMVDWELKGISIDEDTRLDDYMGRFFLFLSLEKYKIISSGLRGLPWKKTENYQKNKMNGTGSTHFGTVPTHFVLLGTFVLIADRINLGNA